MKTSSNSVPYISHCTCQSITFMGQTIDLEVLVAIINKGHFLERANHHFRALQKKGK